ncbi:glycosyltransferase family 2 protein [Pseudomonas proteolytica]|jgi:glycosyltransferase involved in cell wall biosynthesis|uniref:glycosyltransferase family 2 protein n=1 Tax=Pseudomonas proteolytica TaxID=219574 RepID=UPI0023DEFB91|nr:glycosyltransferase family 2 protein [Pseudomonas proteolytica]MDF3162394.1 glycosyltransferase family 2 protein [Pseudomonas proteolytica]
MPIKKVVQGRLQGGARLGVDGLVYSEDSVLVTVVTVVFNDAKNLQRTIDSVASQTYKNIEHIVIDGGSTDGTLDIIQCNPSIAYWLSEKDAGIYDAMNKGIGSASGSWINFMNSGDVFFESTTVESVFLGAEIGAIDLVYGHVEVDYGRFKKTKKSGRVSLLKAGMQFSHQSLFARRTVLEALKFDLSYRTAADYNFIFLSWVGGYRFGSVDLVVSSISSGGVSDVQRLKSLKQRAEIIEQAVGLSARDRVVFFMEYLKIRLIDLAKKVLPESLVVFMQEKK